MGMFDSIWITCSDCGEKVEAQSKSGDCLLNSYTPDSVPADVAIDANRHAPYTCKCGARYKFYDKNEERVSLQVIKL